MVESRARWSTRLPSSRENEALDQRITLQLLKSRADEGGEIAEGDVHVGDEV